MSLTIANSAEGDTGNWTCRAQVFQSDGTEVGDAVEYSIRLVVVGEGMEEGREGGRGKEGGRKDSGGCNVEDRIVSESR